MAARYNLDPDVKVMNLSEVRQEVMRLRHGMRKWRSRYFNELCHEVDDDLAMLLPEKIRLFPIPATREIFNRNCQRFQDRKERSGQFQCKTSCRKSKKTPA